MSDIVDFPGSEPRRKIINDIEATEYTRERLIARLRSENSRLRALLAEAGEVMSPFARAAACAGTAWPDNGLPSHVVGLVNLGHLRAARAFIEKLGRVE